MLSKIFGILICCIVLAAFWADSALASKGTSGARQKCKRSLEEQENPLASWAEEELGMSLQQAEEALAQEKWNSNQLPAEVASPGTDSVDVEFAKPLKCTARCPIEQIPRPKKLAVCDPPWPTCLLAGTMADGVGTGSNEGDCCQDAKLNAVADLPRGCKPKHCNCRVKR
jgi:hypothetical protein